MGSPVRRGEGPGHCHHVLRPVPPARAHEALLSRVPDPAPCPEHPSGQALEGHAVQQMRPARSPRQRLLGPTGGGYPPPALPRGAGARRGRARAREPVPLQCLVPEAVLDPTRQGCPGRRACSAGESSIQPLPLRGRILTHCFLSLPLQPPDTSPARRPRTAQRLTYGDLDNSGLDGQVTCPLLGLGAVPPLLL